MAINQSGRKILTPNNFFGSELRKLLQRDLGLEIEPTLISTLDDIFWELIADHMTEVNEGTNFGNCDNCDRRRSGH